MTIKNRIARLEAEQRRDERARDGYRRNLSELMGLSMSAHAGHGGEYRERLLTQIADREEQIDY